MRMLKPIIVVLLVLLITTFASVATSQERRTPEALDLTMVLLPEGARSGESITRRIELPPAAAAGTERRRGENERPGDADEPQARGAEAAEQARERAGPGLETAEQARELGRELGQQMADQARENRENRGRGERPDEPPGRPDIELPNLPDVPDRPNPPGPPGQ